jgi:hypothetical protein
MPPTSVGTDPLIKPKTGLLTVKSREFKLERNAICVGMVPLYVTLTDVIANEMLITVSTVGTGV